MASAARGRHFAVGKGDVILAWQPGWRQQPVVLGMVGPMSGKTRQKITILPYNDQAGYLPARCLNSFIN